MDCMIHRLFCFLLLASSAFAVNLFGDSAPSADERRLLYVAEPGIRNYLEYGGAGGLVMGAEAGIRNYLELGGAGICVFDIDQGHKFGKRNKTPGLDSDGKPLN